MLGVVLLTGGAALAGDFFSALNQVEEQSENVRVATTRFRTTAALSQEAGRPVALSALEADAADLRRELTRMEQRLARLEAQPPPETERPEQPAPR